MNDVSEAIDGKSQTALICALNNIMVEYKVSESSQKLIEALRKGSNREIETSKCYKHVCSYLDNGARNYLMDAESILYRARAIREDDLRRECGISIRHDGKGSSMAADLDSPDLTITGFDEYESKEPPLSIAGEGRANTEGVSYLYAAEDKYTACCETKPLSRAVLSVTKFKIARPITLFDIPVPDQESLLTPGNEETYGFAFDKMLLEAFSKPAAGGSDSYLISQYLSDLIRKSGYDGIRYHSYYSQCARNVVLFNCAPSIVKFVDSEVVAVVGQTYDIVALNGYGIVKSDETLPESEKIYLAKLDKRDLIKWLEQKERDALMGACS